MESERNNSMSYLGFEINSLKLIGQGHEGRAYLIEKDKVLKIFYNSTSCKSQLETLEKTKGSRFFPTVYDYDAYSIIMSFVPGEVMSYYLSHNALSKELSLELVRLIEEFKKLNFTRLDARLGHIFVQTDETIKIVDPRGSFEIIQPYPVLMLKGLSRHGFLEQFFNHIKIDYPDYYNYWSSKAC